ncbi:CoA transferase [Amycolatopsis dongchuanensis]|uniref:CoA transferase n=1 Tax=Amycolatopsis dongchuanensis TaxID=1070866 RepID=A0ABP9QMY3_9PSEU
MFTGPESVLPGPFRVTEAAARAVAAATVEAAELLQLKGIDPGPVSVDRRHAAAAFRSERYVRLDGEPLPGLWDPLTGDYRAADGWVRLHCNYPHHAEAACRALGTKDLAAAVAKRGAEDVQEAVLAEGGAAAAMRGREEWLAHPQGQVLAESPLVAWDSLGPAPVTGLSTSERPLGGVRVLELTHVIAGPVAGRVLAAHGAEVLHVGAAHLPALPGLWADTGLGKRSAHVDLRTRAGRDTLWRLIGQADVFLQSYRPGALAGLGFTAERLAEARPGIVVAELNAYGWDGPWAGRRGFDSLVQLASGIAAEAAVDGPRPLPAQALDHGTGWLTAAAIMTALRRRALEGGSWRVRLSLARTGLWLDSLGREEGSAGELDVSGLLTRTGRTTHVRVPGELPGAPPCWASAAPEPGGDEARFGA